MNENEFVREFTVPKRVLGKGALAGAIAAVAVAGVFPKGMPALGPVLSAPVAEAAGSRCKDFKGRSKAVCVQFKRRTLREMGRLQGRFVRTQRACAESYRNFRIEKPVWDKVRAYCEQHDNPIHAPYLATLGRRYRLYIPPNCSEACGIAAGKSQYYSEWKKVCK